MPISWVVIILLITTVLCTSTGGLILLLLGGLTLLGVRQYRSVIPLLILMAIPPVYMVTRATGLFEGKVLVGVIKEVVNEQRAGSLEFRLNAENVLSRRAMEQPILGWGGWNRSSAYDETRQGPAVTDGLWIITLGKKGIIGLVGLWGAFLIGPFLLRKRYPTSLWSHPMVAPAVVAAVVVVIHMIDCLPNGMPNAIYYFLGGGLAGLLPMTMARRAEPPAMQHASARPLAAAR
jgi:hypothetical protein